MKIKHVSLDFWNTIAIPNLEFSKLRTELLSSAFSVNYELVKKAYTETKHIVDKDAEQFGKAYDTYHVFQMLLTRLPNVSIYDTHFYEQADEYRYAVNELFLNYPPIISRDIIESIYKLQDKGITVNISSNTNFITGTILSKYMKSTGIFPDFTLYSDIIGYSKPHNTFWKQIEHNATEKHNFSLELPNILHIGDTRATDGKASYYGFTTKIIENPKYLPDTLNEL